MLIDPGVVACLGAVVADALEAGPWIFVEGPSLGAMIARCSRPDTMVMPSTLPSGAKVRCWMMTPVSGSMIVCRRFNSVTALDALGTGMLRSATAPFSSTHASIDPSGDTFTAKDRRTVDSNAAIGVRFWASWTRMARALVVTITRPFAEIPP